MRNVHIINLFYGLATCECGMQMVHVIFGCTWLATRADTDRKRDRQTDG